MRPFSLSTLVRTTSTRAGTPLIVISMRLRGHTVPENSEQPDVKDTSTPSTAIVDRKENM